MMGFKFKSNNRPWNEIFDDKNIYYYFLPSKEIYNKYLEEYQQFLVCEKLDKSKIFFKGYNKFEVDIFIVILINLILKRLEKKEYSINKKDYLCFYSFIKSNILEDKNNNNWKNILSDYYEKKNVFSDNNGDNNENNKEYNNKKFENIDQKLYEILLYGFRYCIQSMLNKSLYSSLLSKDCLSTITGNYIPGIDSSQDQHILTLLDIQNHFNKFPSNKGCYVCSCGHYYSLYLSDIPTKKEDLKICPKCKSNIGFEKNDISKNSNKYRLIKRKDHFRIFKDEKEQKREMNKNKLNNDLIPNKTLYEYIKEIIEPIENQDNPGIEIIDKDKFILKNKRIRNLSMITYRLLNFIIYSHLFFANYFNYLDDEDLENYCLVNNMSCLEIIEYDWEELKRSLKEELISSIEIFMNQIFPKLSELINNIPDIKTSKIRNSFEEQVEILVKECLNNYKNYKKEYIYENSNLLEDKKETMKVIMNELVPPEKYNENDYPMFKYFMNTKYPNIKSLKVEFRKLTPKIYKDRYPLLTQLLFNSSNAKKLKYLQTFNTFSNSLIKYYSFNISRDTAENTKIEEILNNNKEKLFEDKQLDKFIEIYNKIKEDAIYYKEWKKMDIKELSKTDNIIYFLNDNKEPNFGMHIAAAYQSFIYWQNDFIQPIIDSIVEKGNYNFYTNNLRNKIPIQNAKEDNILSLDDEILENIISQYCKRDIYGLDEKINYLNYNNFYYDFDLIENELGKLILSGKCLFDEDYLKFIAFKNENNMKIISDFLTNHTQENLSEEENEKLNSFYEGNKNTNFKDFFNSILILFFFLNENKIKEEETIINVINNLPMHIKVSEEFKNLIIDEFSEEGSEMKINKLFSIFIYLENLYLNDNFNNEITKINDKFKLDFKDEDKVRNTIKNFDDKKGLFLALKRYIFRYLIDNQNAKNIENRNLIYELGQSELWDLKDINIDDIKRNLNLSFKEIKIGNIVIFCDLLIQEI